MATGEELTWQDKLLLFLAVLLFVILLLLLLLFFCKQRLAKWFPCLVCKIKPEDKTGWHHLDRYGELRLKWASYSVAELRGQVDDSVEEGSVHTNISLQVPVFEEKLHSTVKKKVVHLATADDLPPPPELTSPQKKKKKKSKHRHPADLGNGLDPKDSASQGRYYREESV